ncbi:hypothetical protein JW962_01555 [Candidatus Dojkabacteria bacterium]|nr:hypothetical protein [Candidatus Dojkabacteria bacterium]
MKTPIHSEIYHGVNAYGEQSCVVFYLDDNKKLKNNILTVLKHLQKTYSNIITRISINSNNIIAFTYFPWFFNSAMTNLQKLFVTNPMENEQIWEEIKEQIRHEIGNTTYKIVFDALIKKGIPFFPIRYSNKRIYNIGYGKGSTHFQAATTPKDSAFGFKTQKSKNLTNEAAEKLGIPVPKWFLVNTLAELKKAYKKFNGKDIVLKPYNMTRGIGVYVGIKDQPDAISKFKEIKKIYASKKYPINDRLVLIQERLIGKDYRILCLGGKLEIATERIPAYVKGDGVHTINQLIKTENLNPLRDKRNIFNVLKPIFIDNILLDVITEQGYSLDNIPPKGKTVWVRKAASVSQGGFTKDVTNNVHPQIRHYCETISAFMRSHVAGVDIMCEDISKPLDNQSGGLIEVNTKPEIYLNVFPSKGKQYNNFGEKFVTSFVENKPDQSNVVVLKGSLKLKEILKQTDRIIRRGRFEKIVVIDKSGSWITDRNGSYQALDSLDLRDAFVLLAPNNTIDLFVINQGRDKTWIKSGLCFEKVHELLDLKKYVNS